MNDAFLVLAGGLIGAGPGLLGPVLDRRGARKDREAEREHEAHRQRMTVFGEFLGAADRVIVMARQSEPGGGPDEVNALAEARRTASQALLIATPETQQAIDGFLKVLMAGVDSNGGMVNVIEERRRPVIAAMISELNASRPT